MRKILFVDDEVQILRTLSRVFSVFDYELYTANSANEALKTIENVDIDLIISDMRMPGMDGYELLSQVKQKYPKIIRVMLSGYIDQNFMNKCMSKNITKIFIFKPWKNDEIKKIILRLFETQELFDAIAQNTLIHKFRNLVTKLSEYKQIIDNFNFDENNDMIIELLNKDKYLYSYVLQIAKEAINPETSDSVEEIINKIGMCNIPGILFTASIKNESKIFGVDQDYLDLLWQHSINTNKIMIRIYEKCLGKEVPQTFGLIGFFHNIGWIVLASSLASCLKDRTIQEKIYSLKQKEIEYGLTHQELGGYLLSQIGIAYPLIEASLFHHTPNDSRIINKEIVSVIHISQKYAWDMMQFSDITILYPEIFEKIELNQISVEKELGIKY